MESAGEQPTHRPIHLKARNYLPTAIGIHEDADQIRGFKGGSQAENPSANARDADSIPGSGRSPGEENGNPLQYSRLENSTERGAWQNTSIPSHPYRINSITAV